MENEMTTWIAILINMMLVGSVISLLLYWRDKRAAEKGKRRISEKTLHVVALLGGWPGALIGRSMMRHKTIKLRFRVVMWLTIVGHIAIACGITWLVYRLAH